VGASLQLDESRLARDGAGPETREVDAGRHAAAAVVAAVPRHAPRPGREPAVHERAHVAAAEVVYLERYRLRPGERERQRGAAEERVGSRQEPQPRIRCGDGDVGRAVAVERGGDEG